MIYFLKILHPILPHTQKKSSKNISPCQSNDTASDKMKNVKIRDHMTCCCQINYQILLHRFSRTLKIDIFMLTLKDTLPICYLLTVDENLLPCYITRAFVENLIFEFFSFLLSSLEQKYLSNFTIHLMVYEILYILRMKIYILWKR